MSTSSETATAVGLRRDAGIIGLLFASTTSMIGSGWLFGALHASKIAGPLSLVSWILGAVIIMLIALCFAELASLFPRAGALVHMSHASHGEGLGRVWGWMLFLSYVAVPSVEAESIVTYANNLYPHLVGAEGVLTRGRLRRLRGPGRHPGAGESSRHSLASGRQQYGDLVEDRGAAPDGYRPHRRRRPSGLDRSGPEAQASGPPHRAATIPTASSSPFLPRGSCSAFSAFEPRSTSVGKAPIPAATFRWR